MSPASAADVWTLHERSRDNWQEMLRFWWGNVLVRKNGGVWVEAECWQSDEVWRATV